MEGHFGYRFLLLTLILVINGFFAGAEVALISARKSKLRQLAEAGNVGAQAALSLLENPERLLSVTQLGVTLASLGLGWAGEDTLFQMISALLHPLLTPATAGILHGVSFGLAFALMSYGHVIIGEVVPKNLGLEKADRLAVLVAPVLLIFYRVSEPFVFVIERSSVAINRMMGLRGEGHGGGHSAEELKFIVSSSRDEGHLHHFEEDVIQRVLDLRNYYAREIMVPRNDIVSVSVDASLEHVLRVIIQHQYSRIPIYERRTENIVGIVHYKDLMNVWEERRLASERRHPVRPFHLRRVLRKPLVVPETKPLNQLLDEFRQHHTHMALVVDEFGTIAGLVTLEDALEQVFGEIEDEHDERRAAPQEPPTGIFDLDGTATIRDLDLQYGISLPGDAGFETLAGFLLFQLGKIPQMGDKVEYGSRRFTVTEMDRNRIAKVRIETLPAA
ncbi:MAG TPA: hemolysin family protein [Bryobacteraceae bacterium]|nr:hemolysin family protein [Bryobacteraceae bacterium]